MLNKVQRYSTIYIQVTNKVLDEVADMCSVWATGDGSVCTTVEDLLEYELLDKELRQALEHEEGGDVVLHN